MVYNSNPQKNRLYAFEVFNTERMNALRDSLLKNLFGKKNTLLIFPEIGHNNIANRKFLGVTDIPIDKIIGTLGRNCDFDRKFRPLKKHLRDRWINAFINMDSEIWHPIQVYKIEDVYYEEDGHHRTSVARSLGMAFISAEVWEYTPYPYQVNHSRRQICRPRCQPVEIYPT
jgi:hypothetical protein